MIREAIAVITVRMSFVYDTEIDDPEEKAVRDFKSTDGDIMTCKVESIDDVGPIDPDMEEDR